MSALPLAVRVAAGLAAAAVERARRLPQDLVGLPVTAVSRAMQVTMRMQQQITELAIKGDNAIAQLRTPSEQPPWAVFDEDDDPYRPADDSAGLADSAAGAVRVQQDSHAEDRSHTEDKTEAGGESAAAETEVQSAAKTDVQSAAAETDVQSAGQPD